MENSDPETQLNGLKEASKDLSEYNPSLTKYIELGFVPAFIDALDAEKYEL